MRQLSQYLNSIVSFKAVKLPAKGWVRALRDGLGMSRRQLADRLGLSTSRIQRLEEDEVSGAVTIKTLRKTAEAMDCVFIYAMIPRESLEATIKKQANKKAIQYLQDSSHSMKLEDQAISNKASKEMLETITNQIMSKSTRTLWDEKRE